MPKFVATETTSEREWHDAVLELRSYSAPIVVVDPPANREMREYRDADVLADCDDYTEAIEIERRYAERGVAGLREYGEYRAARSERTEI